MNIILGLMPFLDNFAHIGGMLMGFFMGLGLLVQKTEDDLGDRLNKKCYQVREAAPLLAFVLQERGRQERGAIVVLGCFFEPGSPSHIQQRK